jgi:tRNA modification GTPase
MFKNRSLRERPESHRVYYGRIVDPSDGAELDEGLLILMLAPRSYTREDVAEIHAHGNVRLLRRILAAAAACGARPALAGEFTKRAFLNGRIDLSQAEAVAGLIYANSDMAARASLAQLSGRLREAVGRWREEILSLMARIELSVDYPEHDMEPLNLRRIEEGARALVAGIDEMLQNAGSGRILRDGVNTVIAGLPNSGKSSVLNALLREDRAIVTDAPGTTRDLLTEYAALGELTLRLTDTAGIRGGALDRAEEIGVARAREAFAGADLALYAVDGSRGLTEEDSALLSGAPSKCVVLINKADLRLCPALDGVSQVMGFPVLRVSAKDGSGFEALPPLVKSMFFDEGASDFFIYGERHIECAKAARAALLRAADGAGGGVFEDLLSLDLKEAYARLGEITGAEAGEDVIDRIFSEFCVGK